MKVDAPDKDFHLLPYIHVFQILFFFFFWTSSGLQPLKAHGPARLAPIPILILAICMYFPFSHSSASSAPKWWLLVARFASPGPNPNPNPNLTLTLT
jgi:hypothetical protein